MLILWYTMKCDYLVGLSCIFSGSRLQAGEVNASFFFTGNADALAQANHTPPAPLSHPLPEPETTHPLATGDNTDSPDPTEEEDPSDPPDSESPDPSESPTEPDSPSSLLQRGAYEEALALLSKPASADDSLLRARILILTGQHEDALKSLTQAQAQYSDAIPLQAERGRVLGLLGKPREAEQTLLAITNQLGDTPRPGEIQAMLYLLQLYDRFYRIEDIHIESEWIFDYYAQVDNETLTTEAAYGIGVGASIAGDEFNGIKVAALAQKREPDFHPVSIAIGDIFRKKYHYADARREYGRVLKDNPRHPEALLGMAWIELESFNLDDAEERAKEVLAVNPREIDAYIILANVAVYDRRYEDAFLHCETALALRPADPRILEMRAILAYLRDQKDLQDQTLRELGLLYASIFGDPDPEGDLKTIHPPAWGAFLVHLSETLARNHRVDESLAFARKAVEIAPHSAPAQVQLGTMLMRHGLEEEAEGVLATAFRLDPYHVMIHNFRMLLRRNEEYEVLERGRFLLRMPKEDAAIFGEDAARLAEEHLSAAEALYGYKVDRTIRISFLKSQEDFAARVTGLPRFDADGAAFGPFVAIVTPADGLAKSYMMNWETVQLHELAHVVTLIGSGYRIPRWLTEGMSVHLEGWHHPSRDVAFRTMLAEGVWPDLRTWDRSFHRPKGFWEIAGSYKAAGLFIGWFQEDYGQDALVQLLPLYAQGLGTQEIFETVTGQSIEELNAWFHARLKAYNQTLHTHILVNPERHSDMVARLEDNPEDVEAAIHLLRLYRMQGDAEAAHALAKRIADRSLLSKETETLAHQLAFETLVELAYGREQNEECQIYLKKALDLFPESPHLIHFSGLLALRNGDTEEAASAFRNAIRLFPRFLDGGAFDNPYQALATLLYEQEEKAELVSVLSAYTELHRSDPVALRWLGGLQIEREEWKEAEHTFSRLFAVDPYGSADRKQYAHILDTLGQEEEAARQRERIKPCLVREERLEKIREAREQAEAARTRAREEAAARREAQQEEDGMDLDLPMDQIGDDMDPNLQQLLESLYS